MTVDWALAASIVGIVTTISIFVAKRIHASDWTTISALKADNDARIALLSAKIDSIDSYLKDKLDKQEHQIALARIDKEMDVIRREAREDFRRIDEKLDRLLESSVSGAMNRRAGDSL